MKVLKFLHDYRGFATSERFFVKEQEVEVDDGFDVEYLIEQEVAITQGEDEDEEAHDGKFFDVKAEVDQGGVKFRVYDTHELNDMTVAELRDFADERGIDLSGLRLKADIVEAIDKEG